MFHVVSWYNPAVDKNDLQKRLAAAQKLLLEDTTSVEKFRAIKTLLSGVNPRVDLLLVSIDTTLADFEKFEEGKLIDLTLEHLPQNSDEEKRRKKKLILLLRFWDDLKSEVERIKAELQHLQHTKNQGNATTAAKIIMQAKGPFGIVTLAALVIVGGFLLFHSQPTKNVQGVSDRSITQTTPTEKSKMKVIIVQEKKVQLSEFIIGTGPDCDSPHYHAPQETYVTALDGTKLQDPQGCGFGRVRETEVIEVPQ